MTTEFSVENPTKLMEIESFLANNAYLSGEALPGKQDADILNQLNEVPERSKYPNLFSWWWNLSPFQESARELWGKEKKKDKKDKKDKKKDKKDDKKKDKKDDKKEEKKEEKKDDDDIDLFGDDDEDDVEAKKELEKKMAKAKKQKEKEENQKSRVVMEVKGYEVGQDFMDLAKRIFENVKMEGLHWENNAQVLPVGFGMNKLQLAMVILNRLVSADDVLDAIQNKYDEEIQSVDIIDFQTA